MSGGCVGGVGSKWRASYVAPRMDCLIDCDRLADAMNRRQMVLTMNNRRVAELQERETARTQNARSRRIAMGYGR